MNGIKSAPTATAILGQAQRVRAIAVEHENAQTAIARDPNVLATSEAKQAIEADVVAASRQADAAFVRGWGLAHVRSRINADDIRSAAVEVIAGDRPALESLPALAVATVPTAGSEPARKRGRAA